MPTKPRPFAVLAKDIREKLAITQTQAAERIGTSFNSWNGWECGRRNPQKIFQRLLIEMAREAKLNLKKYGDLEGIIEQKKEASNSSGESKKRGR